jgi:sec-independent protein translocase protein TatA
MLRGLEGWHIVIIVAVAAVLFGSRRMPDAARSVGQSLRIFKAEMKAAHEDGGPAPTTVESVPAQISAVTAQQLIDPRAGRQPESSAHTAAPTR